MPENRDGSGKFKPGASGNPGGRPKGIAALAREHKDKAVQVLVDGMDSKDQRVQIAAAREILDRGFGKPVTMSADVTDRLDDLDDDAIDTALNAIRSVIADRGIADKASEKETRH